MTLHCHWLGERMTSMLLLIVHHVYSGDLPRNATHSRGEVRGYMWSYATGKVYEEERLGARRIGGLPRLPAFPRCHYHGIVIAGSGRALDLLLSSTAPMSASQLRGLSCYTTILFLVCSA
jgi:hypothetical protein